MGLFSRKPNVEKLKAKKDVEGLIEALDFEKHRDVDLIRDAVGALAEIGKPTVEPLIQALKHEDETVRSYAAEAFQEIADRRAVEPLIHTLQDNYWYARKASAVALGCIGDARAVESLKDALKDDEEEVREQAEWSLAKIRRKKSSKKKPDRKRIVKPNVEKLKEKKEEREKGVKFVEMKYRDEDFFGPVRRTYEVYSAENKKQAIEFLKTKSVKKKNYYIEVNVGDVNDPEVIVGLDIRGTYET